MALQSGSKEEYFFSDKSLSKKSLSKLFKRHGLKLHLHSVSPPHTRTHLKMQGMERIEEGVRVCVCVCVCKEE